jgi:hypothetical protein
MGQSMTVDEFKAKLDNMAFHVSETRFTDWYEKMGAEYYWLKKLYKDEMTIRKNMPKETLDIIDLPPLIKAELNTTAESLFFSPDGVAKQLGHHPGMAASEYFKALSKIKDCKDGDVIPSGDFKVVVIATTKPPYIAILKTTGSRSETYLVSLYKTTNKYADSLRKKYKASKGKK